ncbi:hypothetical protein Glove_203g23 [Diversispora epigaea]|uniref:Uncharacterized protein n=1 Tax=Diversispora epigaea TaxID=1348612 RepID=A0A397IQS2_9GLOM|nr:hypothetical protein Glove_203g23 [Diversispora epigaea]
MSVSLKINSRRWTRSIFADEGEYDLENELNDFFGRTGKFYFSLFFIARQTFFICVPIRSTGDLKLLILTESAVRARSWQSHAQIGHERTGTGLVKPVEPVKPVKPESSDSNLNINIILPSLFLEVKPVEPVKPVKPESSDSNVGREDEDEEEKDEEGRELECKQVYVP